MSTSTIAMAVTCILVTTIPVIIGKTIEKQALMTKPERNSCIFQGSPHIFYWFGMGALLICSLIIIDGIQNNRLESSFLIGGGIITATVVWITLLKSMRVEIGEEKMIQSYKWGKPLVIPYKSILAVRTGPMFTLEILVSYKKGPIQIPLMFKNSTLLISTLRERAGIRQEII
jgi:hypothetical protein